VVLGQFTGPPATASSAGPGINEILKEELGKNGIKVRRRAQFGIEGKYVLSTDAGGRPVAKIIGNIVDKTGAVVTDFVDHIEPVNVNGTETLAVLFGGTASLPPSQPTRQRERTLLTSIQSPKVPLDQESVKASPASPYAIEIWAYRGPLEPGQDPRTLPYEPCPITNDDGMAIVELNKEEFYAVKLINRSNLDAAVSLSVDGLSMFSFSETKYPYLIVGASKSGIIYGWYISNTTSDAFQITSYAQSAAQELNANLSHVGVITATFRAAWPEDQAPPPDELAAQFVARGKGDEATGRGPELSQEYKEVRRQVGVIRDVISVRYDR